MTPPADAPSPPAPGLGEGEAETDAERERRERADDADGDDDAYDADGPTEEQHELNGTIHDGGTAPEDVQP